ncbi:hypothetical protein HOLleu_35622 [Holothuria leucospilota]|uniref:Uncharacterized protein n=1 Tax=Holothuria leucospilota TaxID=206669 RepID=A0A9Q0YIR0_HOLLE|nr:hypothetical protein HOLleu_35622 [Holothuria leucospilota]
MLSFFEKRHNTKIVSHALHRIQGTNRAEALSEKTNTSTNLRIPLVISYHPAMSPIIRTV